MDIDYALIADYAEIVGGKLYLMGGGWDTTYTAETPVVVKVAIAVGVRVPWNETGQAIPVRMTVEDDDGEVFVSMDGGVSVGRPEGLAPGSAQLTQVAANVAFNAPRFGGYRVLVVAGEGDASVSHALPFRVAPNLPV
jgi:hypothetical protein